MIHNRLFSCVDELEDEYIQFWQDICNIETPSDDKEAVDRLGAMLKDRAKGLGWKIEEHLETKSGNALCFTINEGASGRPVCFSAHMDTVFPRGSFGETPVHIDEKYIYGPGVADCKGGLAAGFLAMHALHNAGFRERPVKLILQSDEENGSCNSQKRTVGFMAEMGKDCEAFLNLEKRQVAANIEEQIKKGYELAVIERKGILVLKFDIYGKAVHSANCKDGTSAVLEAAHKIIALEKMKEPQGLTCNCSTLRGGDKFNVVPEHCTFTADFRFKDLGQMQEAKEVAQEIANTQFVPGTRCEVSVISTRCSLELNEKNQKLLQRINKVFKEVGLPEQMAGMALGGSDGADMNEAGLPVIDSVGVKGDNIHSLRERAELSSLAECAKRAAVIAALL